MIIHSIRFSLCLVWFDIYWFYLDPSSPFHWPSGNYVIVPMQRRDPDILMWYIAYNYAAHRYSPDPQPSIPKKTGITFLMWRWDCDVPMPLKHQSTWGTCKSFASQILNQSMRYRTHTMHRVGGWRRVTAYMKNHVVWNWEYSYIDGHMLWLPPNIPLICTPVFKSNRNFFAMPKIDI